MNTLAQALNSHELIVLRVIGEWWELDLTGLDKDECVDTLVDALNEIDLPTELSYCPPEEAEAMLALARAGGKIAVAAFVRQFGEERRMGPGRLAREEPWLDPVNVTEALWYRGFVYRGFDEADEGMAEFYYIPEELLGQLPRPEPPPRPARMVPQRETGEGIRPKPTSPPPVAAAPPPPVAEDRPVYAALTPAAAPEHSSDAPVTAVDDLTTILASAQRNALNEDNLDALQPFLLDADPQRRSLLITLAWEMGLLRRTPEGVRPTRSAVDWLKQPRETQLRAMLDAWSNSAWNELRRTAGLICEGSGWDNDPILARSALLEGLTYQSDWYALDALVGHIHGANPDFQRPNGDYSTWYIRDGETGAYLSGFANWERVEGRLLRFLVRGPGHWLGMFDLGDGVYRLTPRALAWLENRPFAAAETPLPIMIQADATIIVPQAASRFYRFQVARVADLTPVSAEKPYLFLITPASLTAAGDEGIEPPRVIGFLEQSSGQTLPPSVRRGIERWAEHGTEGFVEPVVVLRVRDAEIIEKLRRNPKTRPFLGESLSDLAVVVQRDAWSELRAAAAQLGLLIGVDLP